MLWRRRESDDAWAARLVLGLPAQWQRRLLARWRGMRRADDVETWWAANRHLRETVEGLARVRGLPLDANDDEVIRAAERCADECFRQAGDGCVDAASARALMEAYARRRDVEPPPEKVKDGPAIARMTCPLWWRGKLRGVLGRRVEGAAVRLGYVHRAGECYVSDEAMRRVAGQKARCAAMLENTRVQNENGDEYTLAELAAKSTGNKAIRRAELMTRIAGFERIARDCGHAGLFVTITCPSRMHKWRSVGGGRVRPNDRYDGTLPREAQAYLCQLWARLRAALARRKKGIYGFRIAEPNHDGTPHWHLLIFCEQEARDEVVAQMRRYALKDSPDEQGADAHRCKVVDIDWERGSAAGYVAKYVAKNIDGYRVETDLLGNDALESSARVEAWAKQWRIRQFQQIGGPPVGVWRELRRVKELPENAPDFLREAHNAVNKLAQIEGRENACVAWDRYCRAQGGVFCGRKHRVRMMWADGEGLNRYGEPKPKKPIGVEAVEIVEWIPPWMAHMFAGKPATAPKPVQEVTWPVESTRHEWVVIGRGSAPAHEVRAMRRRQPAPWTRVNNCTANGRERETNEHVFGVRQSQEGIWAVVAGGAGPDRGSGRATIAHH